MYDLIKVIARIEYKKNNGGRQSPFSSGYRPAFTFEGARTTLSGRIDLIEKNSFAQGDVGEVQITFIKGIIDDTYLKVGQQFTFAEGFKPIGEGEIITVLGIPDANQ